MVTRPYIEKMWARTQQDKQVLLEKCEDPDISAETKMLYLKNHLAENLAMVKEMDQKIQTPAGFPTGEQMFLDALRDMREHPEDYLSEDEDEE